MILFDKEKTVMNDWRTVGFCVISDLENAQQVRLGLEYFKDLLEIVLSLEKLGFSELVLTVEKNHPIVIGSLDSGIALAPRIRPADGIVPKHPEIEAEK